MIGLVFAISIDQQIHGVRYTNHEAADGPSLLIGKREELVAPVTASDAVGGQELVEE